MKVGEAFSSYIKKEDIEDPKKGINVTVVGVHEDSILAKGDEVEKWFMDLEEFKSPLVLNKTNAMDLADLFAEEEMDNWGGKTFNLYVDSNVKFGDKKVGGLRVRAKQ